MTEIVDWIPGLVALAVGSILGVVGAVRLGRRRDLGDASDTPLVDLEEKAAHVIALLRDLEEQRPRLDAATYVAHKQQLEQEAAEALRDRDTKLEEMSAPKKEKRMPEQAATAQPASSVVGFLAERPQLKGFLWGVGTVAVFGIMFLLLDTYQKPRAEGESVTGNAQSSMGERDQSATGSRLRDLMERLRRDPENTETMLELTRLLLAQGMIGEADTVVGRVLKLEPENAQGKVYAALVKSARGDMQAALTDLRAVTEAHPDESSAWLFRGVVAREQGDPEEADAAWERFLEIAPEGPEKQRVQALMSGELPADHPPMGADSLPPDHPPMDSAAKK